MNCVKRSPLRRRAPLRRVSSKRRTQLAHYRELRREFLSGQGYRYCENCGTERATQIHHKDRRHGKLLNDTSTWMALCWQCHQKIHHMF